MKLGPRQLQILPKWIPSLTLFGISGAALVTYGSEWRAVLQYVPYYNGKFKTED
uniref:Cytochrome b-c1 complex subunit 10 n=1 Tax=Riptortus pedestris TaxID=329032 RepID=R4WQV6_RIPPE|nr:unknown secreted protein [Riptortus pedestris]